MNSSFIPKKLLLVAALPLAASLAVTACTTNGESPENSTSGTIAFVSDRTGNDEIYLLDVESGKTKQLTENEGFDRAPSWNQSGTELVFNSRRAPHNELPQIYRISLPELEQNRVGISEAEEQRANWSADGKTVYLHRGVFFESAYNLIAVEVATGTETALTDSTNPNVWNAAPAASPDGKWLLFQSNRHLENPESFFPQQLFALELASGEISKVELSGFFTPETSIDGPRWSDDSKRLTFSSAGQLYLVDTSEPNPSNWTAKAVGSEASDDSAPAFSPDGSQLIFQRYVEGEDPEGADDQYLIYTLDLETGSETLLFEDGRTPVWTAKKWTELF